MARQVCYNRLKFTRALQIWGVGGGVCTTIFVNTVGAGQPCDTYHAFGQHEENLGIFCSLDCSIV